MGVENGNVRKSGAWYTYEGDQLGQGKENARSFLLQNPDVANEIEKKILTKLGIGAGLTAVTDAPVAVPGLRAAQDADVQGAGAQGAGAQGAAERDEFPVAIAAGE
jgi:recombination protein RecA